MSNPQQHLFESEPPAWELDDAEQQLVATVVIPIGPLKELDYSVPDPLAGKMQIGQRVRVPLGRGDRLLSGYCVDLQVRQVQPSRLKSVAGLIDEQSLLSPAMLELTRWIADYYLCGWGQVLDAVVPAAVRGQSGTRVATLLDLSDEFRKLRFDDAIAGHKLTEAQTDILHVLAASQSPLTQTELAKRAGCKPGPISTLRKRGLITSQRKRISTQQSTDESAAPDIPLVLNPDQQAALETICAALDERRCETILIHGVTGSGKTEVYMQAIERVVGFGRQAIVLVPEISLTPQTQERFRARFGDVAVLHSHLTDAQRHERWKRIAQGEVHVVVGPRSAIFAPTPNLGLIVLDEEHEGSFKQESAPRYHARDVARRRAELENIPLVLGSATPSLESWQLTQEDNARLVEMPRRVANRPLPAVRIVDLRDPGHSRFSRGSISRSLHQAMSQELTAGNQVILLLNRRGFSTHIQCHGCGEVLTCPHCEIALTHHRRKEIALCHYCDYEVAAPNECPACKSPGIRYGGLGTQRLEAEVRSRFPNSTCLRMDTDSMRGPGSHEAALARFRSGEVRILLGTQMIAKGLDFPNVTLVGVINSDTALHLPDFRAAERTFHLVTQVAGRTGRGEKGGRVLVQTFTPDHPAIQAAARHDYIRFARQELPIRRQHGYPPFASMVRLVIRGPAEKQAFATAEYLAEQVKAVAAKRETPVRVLGPAPAPIAKLRDLYRFQIQLQAADIEQLRETVRLATEDEKPTGDVAWIVDVDPLDML